MKHPCLILALGAAAIFAARAAEPPNIVLLISDDHMWADYGFMGHEHIWTPHIDRLASESARFDRGYVPTALCRPALATLATGLYVHQHGICGNDPSRDLVGEGDEGKSYAELREEVIAQIDRVPTLPRLLAEENYVSHQSGKWWEGSYERGGFTHGMTRGFPEPGGRHGDAGLQIGREGMDPVFEFIDESVEDEKPFFVWFAPFLPHTPHNPPERLLKKYRDQVDSIHVARYYAMVEWFDETCGQLIGHVEDRGLAENTLFVYVGDNGWIQRPDQPGYATGSKQSAREAGTRQPIMFRWDGVIDTRNRGRELASSIDIVPTVLAAAGADIPEAMPGHNLLPILRSGEPTPRLDVFGEGFAHDIAEIENPEASLLYRWVIEGRWKLIETYDGKVGNYARSHPRDRGPRQLYDLIADPHERNDLSDAHPGLVEYLSERLGDWYALEERELIEDPGADGDSER